MISENTIKELIDRLQYAYDMLERNPIRPLKKWKDETNWLLFQTQLDLNNENYNFEGLVSKQVLSDIESELEDVKDRLEDYENE